LNTPLALKVFAMLLSGHEPIDKDATRHHVAIASHGVAGWEAPAQSTARCSRRFRSIRGGNILMMITIVAAVLGLTRLAPHVPRNAQEPEPDAKLFVIVRSEVLCIWLPQTLTELAKRQAQSRFVRTHEELQRFLDLKHQQTLWYALSMRAYDANGEFSDVTCIRRPYDDSLYFPEVVAILATVAGTPPHEPNSDFSRASVHIIADEFLNGEPREVMAELLG
jgi:hypothetical protein